MFIHSPADGNLSHFQFGAIIIKVSEVFFFLNKVFTMYNLVSLDRSPQPGNHCHNQETEHFHHPQKFPPDPAAGFSSTPVSRWPLICFLLLEINLDFQKCYINGIIICMLLCLSSFTQYNNFKIHPCYCVYQYFISFHCLSSAPLNAMP